MIALSCAANNALPAMRACAQKKKRRRRTRAAGVDGSAVACARTTANALWHRFERWSGRVNALCGASGLAPRELPEFSFASLALSSARAPSVSPRHNCPLTSTITDRAGSDADRTLDKHTSSAPAIALHTDLRRAAFSPRARWALEPRRPAPAKGRLTRGLA